MRHLAALAALLVLPAAFMAARRAPGRSTGRPSRAQDPFLGTWKLVSTEEKLKDGTSRPYLEVGAHGTGYLIYAADGHMCAELAGADRPRWDTRATSEQKIAAFKSFTAYCGRFEVDEVNHVMWHYPELALDPNFAGTKQPRPYRLEGRRLIFSGKQAPEEEDQSVDRWIIVWEKANP